MDGTSLKNSYKKAINSADLYYKYTVIGILFLVLGVILNFLPLIILNAILIVVSLPLTVHHQKLSQRAMNLYSWKYDADDFFEEEGEEEKENSEEE